MYELASFVSSENRAVGSESTAVATLAQNQVAISTAATTRAAESTNASAGVEGIKGHYRIGTAPILNQIVDDDQSLIDYMIGVRAATQEDSDDLRSLSIAQQSQRLGNADPHNDKVKETFKFTNKDKVHTYEHDVESNRDSDLEKKRDSDKPDQYQKLIANADSRIKVLDQKIKDGQDGLKKLRIQAEQSDTRSLCVAASLNYELGLTLPFSPPTVYDIAWLPLSQAMSFEEAQSVKCADFSGDKIKDILNGTFGKPDAKSSVLVGAGTKPFLVTGKSLVDLSSAKPETVTIPTGDGSKSN
jgi:hypothetical protein